MREYVSLADWLVYGILSVAAASISVATLLWLRRLEFSTWLVLVFAPWALAVLSISVPIWRYQHRATYTTKHGIIVWTNGLRIPQRKLERITFVFVRALPLLIRRQLPPGSNRQMLTEYLLRVMLQGVTLEFYIGTLPLFSRRGWKTRDATGVQRGKEIRLQWTGTFSIYAYYHALLHVVDEVLLHRDPDDKHNDKTWWALATVLARLAAADSRNL